MQLDLVVTDLPVAALVPYAENARTHSPAQVAQIAASIAEFGFVNPVLVDAEGVLIVGHGRVLAAEQLGLASAPALRLGHLSPAQARALRLADNQIALNSGWDEALLAAEIARIRDEAVVDLDLLGFSGMELDRLLAAADAGFGDDADEAPAPPVVPVTRQGDLWRCGEHRLLCGDVSWLAPVLARLRDLGDYEAALLLKAKIEAFLAAVVSEEGDEALTGAAAGLLRDAQARTVESFEPGMIPYRRGVGSVEVVNPSGGGSHAAFARRTLEAAAVGAGLTYDQVSGDLTQANYSSLRAGKIEFRRLCEQVQYGMLIPMLVRPIAVGSQRAGTTPRDDQPSCWLIRGSVRLNGAACEGAV